MVVAMLIGDVVASKQHGERDVLQERLQRTFTRIEQSFRPLQPLEPTIGDEFQGCFATVAHAARASLLARLMLLVDEHGSDSRYGLGWGEVTVFDAHRSPVSQDGPGWWSARAAIERAAGLATSPGTSFVRTGFVRWRDDPTSFDGYEAAVEAFLLCRDAAIAHMSDRQRRLLLGVLEGHTQADLAKREGITQSAVSQTLSRSGAAAIQIAHRRLEALSS